MARSIEEIHADRKALEEEEKKAIKEHKRDAIKKVKELILQYKITKGDIRGKAVKQLGL